MISKSLGHSRRFADVRNTAGRLGEFAQALYPLLVANADAMGRQAGDPFTVKHAVFPTSPRKEAEFAEALHAMQDAGLILWYEPIDPGGGQQVVEIVDFDKHQDLHKEAKKSTLPELSGNFRKIPRISPLIKSNSIQFKRTVADATAQDADLSSDLVSNAEIAAFLKTFCELYSKHRHGAKYLVKRQKDVPLVRTLLTVYGSDRLQKIATVLLTTDEPWIDETDRGIGILTVKASWCDGRLSAYEAEHGAKAAS